MKWANTYLTTYEFICSHFKAPKESLKADLLHDSFGIYYGYFHAKLLEGEPNNATLFFPGLFCPYGGGVWSIGTRLHYDISNKNCMVLRDGDWLIYIYADKTRRKTCP